MKITKVRLRQVEGVMKHPDPFWEERLVRPVDVYPKFKAEGPSRCTIELEPEDNSVKLTITHEIDRPDSPFITAVSDGWPRILSNLKSVLETGKIVL